MIFWKCDDVLLIRCWLDVDGGNALKFTMLLIVMICVDSLMVLIVLMRRCDDKVVRFGVLLLQCVAKAHHFTKIWIKFRETNESGSISFPKTPPFWPVIRIRKILGVLKENWRSDYCTVTWTKTVSDFIAPQTLQKRQLWAQERVDDPIKFERVQIAHVWSQLTGFGHIRQRSVDTTLTHQPTHCCQNLDALPNFPLWGSDNKQICPARGIQFRRNFCFGSQLISKTWYTGSSNLTGLMDLGVCFDEKAVLECAQSVDVGE